MHGAAPDTIQVAPIRPPNRVAISAGLNLVGAFLSVKVAKTIPGGIVDETKITPEVVFAGLIGAIVWNLLTWLFGLPPSSSHGDLHGSAPVAIEVAMALPVSWKPLVKSKDSTATTTTRAIRAGLRLTGPQASMTRASAAWALWNR